MIGRTVQSRWRQEEFHCLQKIGSKEVVALFLQPEQRGRGGESLRGEVVALFLQPEHRERGGESLRGEVVALFLQPLAQGLGYGGTQMVTFLLGGERFSTYILSVPCQRFHSTFG